VPTAGSIIRASDIQTPSATDMQMNTFNVGDFTSGTMADWLTGMTVPVPVWAQGGASVVEMVLFAHPIVISAASTFALRLVVAATNGDTLGGLQVPTVTTVMPVAIPFTVSGSGYTIPVGTASLAVKAQAQRTAGTGALRLSATTTNNITTLLSRFH